MSDRISNSLGSLADIAMAASEKRVREDSRLKFRVKVWHGWNDPTDAPERYAGLNASCDKSPLQ